MGAGANKKTGGGRNVRVRHKDLRADVAAKIKAWRVVRTETQATVARALGVSESTVNMWEAGERFPNPENLLGLAEVLGIPPCRFFRSAESACSNVRTPGSSPAAADEWRPSRRNR